MDGIDVKNEIPNILINWDAWNKGKNKFYGKKIKTLIKKEFGAKRLKEIENIKEFENNTLFFDECKFTPYKNNEKKNIISVLDKKSFYDWDTIINGGGIHTVKFYLTPHAYFFCDENNCSIEEDA